MHVWFDGSDIASETCEVVPRRVLDYIYSRADRACRAAELESLLEARRAACAPAPAAGPLLPPFPVATAEDAQSLLLEACREGSAAAAAAALAAGASAAEADGLGNTPLHVAATRGC